MRHHGGKTRCTVSPTPRTGTERNLAAVTSAIGAARLPGAAHRLAVGVFERLTHAGSRIHGASAGEVHFHEAGALDAIADVPNPAVLALLTEAPLAASCSACTARI